MNVTPRLVTALRTAALLLAASAGALSAAGEAPNGGTIRVGDRTLTLSHGYLFHAPDAFEEGRRNAIVLLLPMPLAEARLGAATTLQELLALTGERAVVEVFPDGNGEVSLCHEGFGEGMCFRSGMSRFESRIEPLEGGRVAGTVRSFAGEEETVFDDYRLLFDLRFDLRDGHGLAARR